MKLQAGKLMLSVGVLTLAILICEPVRAQVADVTPAGGDGQPVMAALNGLQSEAQNQSPNESQSTPQATPQSATPQNTQQTAPQQQPPENLPNAPTSNRTEPSLGDLGITPEQAQGNAKEQALLDKRTHMLKIHQRMGLITLAPLVATVVTSVNAGGKDTSSTDRNVHAALGSATAGLYFTTAYFAIRAPRLQGTETRGPIKLHKALAWIHGPGMILTPILGAMAYSQKSNGEKVHGIASAHGPVAIVTAGAYGAAMLSVSLKF